MLDSRVAADHMWDHAISEYEVVIWRDLRSSQQLARFGRILAALTLGLALAAVALLLLASEEWPAVFLSATAQQAIEAKLDSQLTQTEQEQASARGWSRAKALSVASALDHDGVLLKEKSSHAPKLDTFGQHEAMPPTLPSSKSSSLWDFPEIRRYQEASKYGREKFWDKMDEMKSQHKYSLLWPSAGDADLSWPSSSVGERHYLLPTGAEGGRRGSESSRQGRDFPHKEEEARDDQVARKREEEEEPEYDASVERKTIGESQDEESQRRSREHESGEGASSSRSVGGYVRPGDLLRRGDISPVTRPFVRWGKGCTPQICPLDTPQKERKYAWQYCTNHFVTNAEKRYCYQAVLSPPVPPPACPPYPTPPLHTRVLLPPRSDTVDGDQVRVGASVTIECEEGYKVTGNARPACLEDKTYEQAGECVPIECASPPAPEHGSVEPGGELEFGEEARLACDDGYEASGPVTARCGPGGTVGPLGSCVEVTCPPLDPPPHAEASPATRVAVGEHVTVTCTEGYEAAGDAAANAVCGPDGELEGGKIECTPVHCPPMTAPEHGTVTGPGEVQVGEAVTVQCDEGFVAVAEGGGGEGEGRDGGSSMIKTVGEGGSVVEVVCKGDKTYAPSVVCVGYCEPYPAVEHGSVTPGGRVKEGGAVTVECEDEWYSLDNCEGGKATCTHDREYDNSNCQCNLIPSCPPFAPPAHGSVTPSGRLRPGDQVHVVCDDGYEFEEGVTTAFECKDDGTYGEAVAPKCHVIPECPPYAAPAHGSASPSGVTTHVGDQVHVTCDSGYHLGPASSSIVTCTGTEYDYPVTKCVPLPSCGPYGTVPHGHAQPAGNITEGHCVEIKCDAGFEMDDNDGGHAKPCCIMDIVAGRLKFERGKQCMEPPCDICNDRNFCPHCFIGPKKFPAKRREFNFD